MVTLPGSRARWCKAVILLFPLPFLAALPLPLSGLPSSSLGFVLGLAGGLGGLTLGLIFLLVFLFPYLDYIIPQSSIFVKCFNLKFLN